MRAGNHKLERALKRDTIIGKLVVAVLAEATARVRFRSIGRTAGKFLALGVALFVGLHLIPRLVLHSYGMIWGTLIPILSGILVVCSAAGLLGFGLRKVSLQRRIVSLRRSLTRTCRYCQICGKSMALTNEVISSLLQNRLAAARAGSPEAISSSDFLRSNAFCSEDCRRTSIEGGLDSLRYCWSCGKEDVTLGSCEYCGLLL